MSGPFIRIDRRCRRRSGARSRTACSGWSLPALAPGAAVPSVRDLARELKVNPMTVSKAYQRLSEAGVFEVKRGEGTFVAQAPPVMRRAETTRTLREAAGRYVASR